MGPDILTDSELVRFWQAYHSRIAERDWQDAYFLAAVILATGVRRAEACNLALADCRLKPICCLAIMGKGGKQREAEVIPEFCGPFRARITEYRGHLSKWVFPGATWRQPLGTAGANRYWNRVLQDIGIGAHERMARNLGCHAGRRTFASYYRHLRYYDAQGRRLVMRPEDLAAQLGHSRFDTTLRYYARSLPGQRFQEVELQFQRYIAGPIRKETPDET